MTYIYDQVFRCNLQFTLVQKYHIKLNHWDQSVIPIVWKKLKEKSLSFFHKEIIEKEKKKKEDEEKEEEGKREGHI